MSDKLWMDDSVQPPRLLDEIAAAGLAEHQYRHLQESTGLRRAQIDKLFRRATDAWEQIKEKQTRER